MAVFTVTQRSTTAYATQNVNAANHEAAVAAAITAVAGGTGAGATGTEYHVPSCIIVTGPTGWGCTTNYTLPATGSTYSAVSHEDAVNQAVLAGPTGPGSGIQIFTAQ